MLCSWMFLIPTALGGTVQLSWPHFKQLLPDDETVEEEGPEPFVAWRDVVLVPTDEGVVVKGEWHLVAKEPGWFSEKLLGGGASLENLISQGADFVETSDANSVIVTGWVDSEALLRVEALVVGDPHERVVPLDLLPAVRGQVTVESSKEVQLESSMGPVVGVGDGFWTGCGELTLRLAEPLEKRERNLIVAHAGLGMTIGDSELRGQAHLQWEVLQGQLDSFVFRLSGVGDDLEVKGDNVRGWRREGDRVFVEAQRPVKDLFEVYGTWSRPIGGKDEEKIPLPTLVPLDVFRADASLQVARDSELEVVPELSGWEALAAAELPDWGTGLIDGTPTAAYRAGKGASGKLNLYRFVPVPGPAVVVDVASHNIATTVEGRTLIRSHYEVRNERAAYLRVVPPAGAKIIGVRVGQDVALPVVDGKEGWLVPLQRSVETVEGLLSFPVEVIFLGESELWALRERRSLPLPAVDAQVVVSRVRLYLPPGYSSLLESGEESSVDEFTEGDGITYGFGVGEVGAAKADKLYQQALDAWMHNRFDEAQGFFGELEDMGASNENIRRLESNLIMVEGNYEGEGDLRMERRVRGQAQARAVEEDRRQKHLAQNAEEEMHRGKYEEAERMYQEALEIGRQVQKLEQTESREVENFNRGLREKLAVVEEQKQERDKRLSEIEEQVDELKERVYAAKARLQGLRELRMYGVGPKFEVSVEDGTRWIDELVPAPADPGPVTVEERPISGAVDNVWEDGIVVDKGTHQVDLEIEPSAPSLSELHPFVAQANGALATIQDLRSGEEDVEALH
ncbi:MAG: hypothetical protein HN348_16830, partial [Proteobacteria bacterium]|nr:hypothetical protein [Pseudomonadota bacterium]